MPQKTSVAVNHQFLKKTLAAGYWHVVDIFGKSVFLLPAKSAFSIVLALLPGEGFWGREGN